MARRLVESPIRRRHAHHRVLRSLPWETGWHRQRPQARPEATSKAMTTTAVSDKQLQATILEAASGAESVQVERVADLKRAGSHRDDARLAVLRRAAPFIAPTGEVVLVEYTKPGGP